MQITLSRSPLPTYLTVDGTPLQSIKYLGVYISSNLTWGQHISNTCKKAKKHLGLLHQKFHQASPQVRSKLYSSVILPRLEYCSSVWDPHQAKYVSMLESVQTFGCRVISKGWNSNYPTQLTHLRMATLQSCRKQQRLIMCYKSKQTDPVFLPPTSSLACKTTGGEHLGKTWHRIGGEHLGKRQHRISYASVRGAIQLGYVRFIVHPLCHFILWNDSYCCRQQGLKAFGSGLKS